MAPIFPAEIVHEFILHINEGNERKETLLSCNLVSQTWWAIARPYLYSQVALIIDHDATKANSLPAILSNSPHIRACVHHLLISLLRSPAKPSPLGLFPSLRSLQIDSGNEGRRLMNQEFMITIHPILSSRVLTSLALSDLRDVPVRLLRQCVALEKLSIRRVTLIRSQSDIEEDGVTSCQLEERPYLKSLVLSTREELDSIILKTFRSARSPFDLSQLETFMGLDRCNGIGSYENHCKFISHVSNTLKNILIDPPTACLLHPLVNVSLKPHELRKISHITLAVVQEPSSHANALPWVIAFLSGIPNPETLHALTLLCDLEYHDGNDFTFHLRGWSELDTLLNRFHNLQQVDLKFYDERNDDVAKRLGSWIRSQLPTLISRGILTVACTSEFTYQRSLEDQLMG